MTGAQTAFSNLEEWTGYCSNWQHVMRLVALLTLSYTDQKFRDWISRLQVEWMVLQPRDEVHVTQGFWKVISADSLLRIFQSDDTRTAETLLLADYDILLGQAFVEAQKDIRPFLSSWAEELALSLRQASDEDTLNQHAPSTGHEASCVSGKASTEDFVDFTQDVVLEVVWMDRVSHYEEQVVVQSLFLQSLRRLQSLAEEGGNLSSLAAAYMLLDSEDGKTRALPEDETVKAMITKLAGLPPVKPIVCSDSVLIDKQIRVYRKEQEAKNHDNIDLASYEPVHAVDANLADGGQETPEIRETLCKSFGDLLDADVQCIAGKLDLRATEHAQQLQQIKDAAQKTSDRLDAQATQEYSRFQDIQAQLQAISDAVEALQQAPQEPVYAVPQPGQEGYLALHCAVPEGCDQNPYEAVLLSAGWFYVACLNSRTDGFEPNPTRATVNKHLPCSIPNSFESFYTDART
ncbi:hypothetical protein N0V93_010313 [Gnomoniopsis smithogilvyi]|uniref:Uncharacterized protein n=1 Tax=Gnomoniopsis smithogilvyi TaxID=1191159 RepID=A0A9W8YJU7_9PEZI|nr:hypothetical protein N0V93_010313 [Gnomoniopsis smithogilvyi]